MGIPVNLHLDKVPYRALGSKVLVRVIKRSKLRGVELPDSAPESDRYFAVAVGPKVEGITPGDEVIIGGGPAVQLSGEKDLLILIADQCFLVKTDAEVIEK